MFEGDELPDLTPEDKRRTELLDRAVLHRTGDETAAGSTQQPYVHYVDLLSDSSDDDEESSVTVEDSIDTSDASHRSV